MLIIKRFAGQAVVIENAAERFEVAVVAVRQGVVQLDVAGNAVEVSKGAEIKLRDEGRGALLMVVEQVGLRGIRLGFKGDLSRRIYRKEGMPSCLCIGASVSSPLPAARVRSDPARHCERIP